MIYLFIHSFIHSFIPIHPVFPSFHFVHLDLHLYLVLALFHYSVPLPLSASVSDSVSLSLLVSSNCFCNVMPRAYQYHFVFNSTILLLTFFLLAPAFDPTLQGIKCIDPFAHGHHPSHLNDEVLYQ